MIQAFLMLAILANTSPQKLPCFGCLESETKGMGTAKAQINLRLEIESSHMAAIDGRSKGNGPRQDTLTGCVNYDEQSKRVGSLNPQFVEWLMGFPKNWTDPGSEL